MYSISLNLGNVTWQLLYKEKPEVIVENLRTFMRTQHLVQGMMDARCITIPDDFGQECDVVAGSLHGFLFEDKDLTQEAVIQQSLFNALTNIKVQKRAASDPAIRSAQQVLGSGMPAFMPGVNGRLS